jgi:hypothetical protein
MTSLTAVLDACVLYPAPLRDLLLQLSLAGLYRARWTDEIHGEWMASLLARRPDLTHEQLDRTRTLMNASGLDCLVTGYAHLVDGLQLPDECDRHVLAAAIRCGAAVIVTCNQRDFPAAYLGQFGIEAQHPDAFIAELMDADQQRVLQSVRRVRLRLRNPPMSADEYLHILSRQSLPATVTALDRHRTSI